MPFSMVRLPASRRMPLQICAAPWPLTDPYSLRGARRHAPEPRGARHGHDALAAVLLLHLGELLVTGLDGLVPADAHPAGILALGVGALQRVVQAVGMVGCLDGRLRLRAAVAVGLVGRLIALHFNSPPVLDSHPHAALHLAAATACRAHALDVGGRSGAARVGKRLPGGRDRPGDHGASRDHAGQLQKASPRGGQRFSHSRSSLVRPDPLFVGPSARVRGPRRRVMARQAEIASETPRRKGKTSHTRV